MWFYESEKSLFESFKSLKSLKSRKSRKSLTRFKSHKNLRTFLSKDSTLQFARSSKFYRLKNIFKSAKVFYSQQPRIFKTK